MVSLLNTLLKETKQQNRIIKKCKTYLDQCTIPDIRSVFRFQGRIRLDIGGNIFTTSRLTLTQDPESMLAAMFSGRHNICLETDGTVFIDRDGTHFRYILNYLRDGRLNTDGLPRNRQVLRELRNEATYYQLHSLLQEIEKLF